VKYIIVRTPDGEAPVVFPRAFLHRYVATLFAPMEVTAAGFVTMTEGRLRCYGKSAGLRLPSRPELDTALVNARLDGAQASPWTERPAEP
jgi:hypothetical protein